MRKISSLRNWTKVRIHLRILNRSLSQWINNFLRFFQTRCIYSNQPQSRFPLSKIKFILIPISSNALIVVVLSISFFLIDVRVANIKTLRNVQDASNNNSASIRILVFTAPLWNKKSSVANWISKNVNHAVKINGMLNMANVFLSYVHSIKASLSYAKTVMQSIQLQVKNCAISVRIDILWIALIQSSINITSLTKAKLKTSDIGNVLNAKLRIEK